MESRSISSYDMWSVVTFGALSFLKRTAINIEAQNLCDILSKKELKIWAYKLLFYIQKCTLKTKANFWVIIGRMVKTWKSDIQGKCYRILKNCLRSPWTFFDNKIITWSDHRPLSPTISQFSLRLIDYIFPARNSTISLFYWYCKLATASYFFLFSSILSREKGVYHF